MNRPPSQKYQMWPQIILLFTILFFVQTVALWFFTWGLFEGQEWGAFALHLPSIISILGYVIPSIDYGDWLSYWELLDLRDSQYKFVMHFGLPIVVSAISSAWLIKLTLWIPGGREYLVNVKGPVLLDGYDAIHHARAMNGRDLRSNKRTSRGVKIHPDIEISDAREQNNLAIFGTTGAGKSMTFKPLVSQALDRGDYAFIYDEKGEYTVQFYEKETTSLIAPWDSRSVHWNIYQDVKTKEDAELIAACMIPNEGEKEPMWVEGARLLFVGMMLTLIKKRKPWGWGELFNLISAEQEETLVLLKINHPIAKAFIQKESKTTQGFYVKMISRLKWIGDLGEAWPKPIDSGFSIKKWVNESAGKKVIILQSDSRFESIGAPLCNTIIGLITQYYLALEDGAERRTWLFIDEFANLPRNKYIQKWLELARSRGARSVICTQSISQLREIYGNNDTDAILNLLSNVISLRVGAGGEDAKYVSRIFGEKIVERLDSTGLYAKWIRSKEPLVEEFEITQLKPTTDKGVEGYLFVPGWNATYKLVWPLFTKGAIAKKHCPAAWLENRDEKNKAVQKKINRLNKRAS